MRLVFGHLVQRHILEIAFPMHRASILGAFDTALSRGSGTLAVVRRLFSEGLILAEFMDTFGCYFLSRLRHFIFPLNLFAKD
jgi:hypothetical protein